MLHILKLKSYENNVAEQNEQIKLLNNEILELVQVKKFDKEMNSTFSFNDKIHYTFFISNLGFCLRLGLLNSETKIGTGVALLVA